VPSSPSPTTDGWRFQVFITNQQEEDIAELEARHRARARCEDCIRCAKETGLRAFPFKLFRHNQVWLELVLAAHDLLCRFDTLTQDHRDPLNQDHPAGQ
jgi:hypothetical protein